MSEQIFCRAIVLPMLVKAGAHVTCIESPMHGVGFPDLNVCLNGREINVELKYGCGRLPKIRSTQLKWFTDRMKAGGKPLIMACLIREGEAHVHVYSGHRIYDLYRATAFKRWENLADYTTPLKDHLVNKDLLLTSILRLSSPD